MKPKYSKNEVKRAGKKIASGSLSDGEEQETLQIVNHWRAAHMEPMYEALGMLESACGDDGSTFLVSRLKRTEMIINKLRRKGETHTLNTLDDIAGCRIIVDNNDDVLLMVDEICAKKSPYHERRYLAADSKPDGYRGAHLIYRYDSKSYGYEGLRVEVQIRSRAQHDWATAVEIYDILAGSHIKCGICSQGEARYFQLASSIINDDCNDMPSSIAEIKELEKKLGVLDKLRGVADSLYDLNSSGRIDRSDYCLIKFNISEQIISTEVYPSAREDDAIKRYTELETSENEGRMYLLARAGSYDDLQLAYMNYYSNPKGFINRLECYLGT